jgi:hypothetical protein
MQERGNGNVGDFGWVQSKILEGLIRDGFNLDFVESLREKIAAIEMHVQAFRATRQQLGDSGKYTPQGLVEAERELAVPVAGEIRKLMDDTHLRNNILQTERELNSTTKPDPTEALVNFWREMEYRTIYQQMGIVGDPIKANLAYREALAKGDVLAMRSLENWPLGSPVDDVALLAQGREARDMARNPLAAKKLSELRQLQEAMARVARDALQELPLAQPDPLEQLARGESVSAGETEA